MDPVSALGIASSVITFVDFASKLTEATTVIFRSKEGASTENLVLENIYAKLEELSARLASSTCPPQLLSSSQLEDVLALQDLSVTCRQDCREMIDALQALKVRGQKNRLWRSVKAAFKAELGRQKLAAIEGRLERTQRAVSLCISSILSHQVSQLSKTVKSMSDGRAGVGQASTIVSMTRDLATLKLKSESVDARTQSIFSADQVELFASLLSSLAKAEERLQAGTAHHDTFLWAFKDSHLSSWLCSGNGVFWISGRAGSGKSTFMKFLAGHSQTHELLARWADSKEPAIAAHYFWSAGTTMQKSQQGLLQSLLFSIFSHCPKSVRTVSPLRWGNAGYGYSKPWTISELSDTLRALAIAENMPLKFCFFIDGLDEYEGDHIELCNVLLDMSRSSNIKICLSSRPWVVFEDSFGADDLRKLHMHDMTRDDIESFARDQLQTHPRWAITFSDIGENEKRDLIEKVAERAEGVFLWAFLVTRSLREGLSNDDTIADMWRRLESLPKDLQRLFRHMLDSVDTIYHSKMAGTLQVAIHAFEPMAAYIYWHLEKEFEEQDYAIQCPISVPSPAQCSERREQIRRRINARTKGLLEMRNDRVEFLHRTVRDFLLTAEMSDYLTHKSSTSFCSYSSITKSCLALLKTTSYVYSPMPSVIRQEPGQNGGLFIAHLNHALLYAAEALKTSAPNFEKIIELLDEYERSVVKMIENSHITIGGAPKSCDPRLVFREEVVRHQLAQYVRRKVQQDPGYFCIFQDSPLFAALTPMTIASGASPFPEPEMLALLLQLYSSLAFFMQKYKLNDTTSSDEALCHALEKGIFDLLLSHHADPDAPVGTVEGRTVFYHFFTRIIIISKRALFEASLCTLDAFLRAQPSLNSLPRKRHDIRMSGLIIKYPLTHISQFIWYMYNPPLNSGPFDSEQLEFHSTIIERLIRYALDQHQDLTSLASTLRESCRAPSRQCMAQLLDLIKGGGHNITTPKRPRDSSGEEVDGREPTASQSRKRGRAS
ncbi:hypothetical protein F4859DRAFT_504944 [Xylaria cf. heliscus]|nr:hypothetical protein F4859DRAFT_504944 [Xylaria cf. heliscus]